MHDDLSDLFTSRFSFDGTWENVLGVGSVRMDPAVSLLYDALEHDAVNFVDFCPWERDPEDFSECVASSETKQFLLITSDENEPNLDYASARSLSWVATTIARRVKDESRILILNNVDLNVRLSWILL